MKKKNEVTGFPVANNKKQQQDRSHRLLTLTCLPVRLSSLSLSWGSSYPVTWTLVVSDQSTTSVTVRGEQVTQEALSRRGPFLWKDPKATSRQECALRLVERIRCHQLWGAGIKAQSCQLSARIDVSISQVTAHSKAKFAETDLLFW